MFNELRDLNVLKDKHFLNPVDFGFVEETEYDKVNGIDLVSNYDSGFFTKEIVEKQSMTPIVTYTYQRDGSNLDFELTVFDVPVSEVARPGVSAIEGFFELPNQGVNSVNYGIALLSFMKLCLDDDLSHLLPYPATARIQSEATEMKAYSLSLWISSYVAHGVVDVNYYINLLNKIYIDNEGDSLSWSRYQEVVYNLASNRMHILINEAVRLVDPYYEKEYIQNKLVSSLSIISIYSFPKNELPDNGIVARGYDSVSLGLDEDGNYIGV